MDGLFIKMPLEYNPIRNITYLIIGPYKYEARMNSCPTKIGEKSYEGWHDLEIELRLDLEDKDSTGYLFEWNRSILKESKDCRIQVENTKGNIIVQYFIFNATIKSLNGVIDDDNTWYLTLNFSNCIKKELWKENGTAYKENSKEHGKEDEN